MGKQKLFVILGFRLSAFSSSAPLPALSRKDVRVIDLFPVEKSNGDVVYTQLKKVSKKIGPPRLIIADHGSDIKLGVETLQKEYPKIDYIYDVKHKMATLLKNFLEKDEIWKQFSSRVAKTKQRVKQTSAAPLAPPGQRTKTRYMNVDGPIAWGVKALRVYDKLKNRRKVDGLQDFKKAKEELKWLEEYREEIETKWAPLMKLVSGTETFVRENGFSKDTKKEFKKFLKKSNYPKAIKKVKKQIIGYIGQESGKAKAGERLFGSSEILESIFGVFKNMEGEQAKSGFTGLLFSLPAMLGDIGEEIIAKAMDATSVKSVLKWVDDNVGETLQAARRKVFQCENSGKETASLCSVQK